MLKNIVVSIVAFLVGCSITFWVMNCRMTRDFVYSEEIPKFSDAQKETLNALGPSLWEEVPCLYQYYVSGVSVGEATVTVVLAPLQVLQNGRQPNAGMVRTMGERVELTFDSEYNVLAKTKY